MKVTAVPDPTYQWLKNDAPIPGARGGILQNPEPVRAGDVRPICGSGRKRMGIRHEQACDLDREVTSPSVKISETAALLEATIRGADLNPRLYSSKALT